MSKQKVITSQWKAALLSVGPLVPMMLGYIAYQSYPVWGKDADYRVMSPSGFDITPMSEAEVERVYGTAPKQVRRVCRDGAVEHPWPHDNGYDNYYKNEADGVYVSAVSKVPLFDSKHKLAAASSNGSGHPNFSEVLDKSHIALLPDHALDFERTEVIDRKSRAHLGHVFSDGPPPHHSRYCIKGAALKFIPRNDFEELYSDYVRFGSEQHLE